MFVLVVALTLLSVTEANKDVHCLNQCDKDKNRCINQCDSKKCKGKCKDKHDKCRKKCKKGRSLDEDMELDDAEAYFD